jgi:acetyltransferase-like isoleucine patch superfamily enzyme
MIYHLRPGFEHLIFRLIGRRLLRRRLKSFGEGSFVSPFTEILGIEHISVGRNVHICHDTRLLALEHYAGVQHASPPSLSIGDGTFIGHWCVLSCMNSIRIGSEVTLGDNVYVADSSHGFENVHEHIMKQPLVKGSITIGDRAWLGKNAVVTHNLTIGENAIVGANSFVNRDVPPFTMVAGSPAVPIKRYDFDRAGWVSI